MSQSKNKVLRAAIQAVYDGCPTNADLAKMAAERKLRFSYSSVAKEAGVSRTLISGENCRYPHIRDEIEALLPSKTPLLRTLEDLTLQTERLLTTVTLQRASLALLFWKLRKKGQEPVSHPVQPTILANIASSSTRSAIVGPLKGEIERIRLRKQNIERRIARRDALYARVVITAVAYEQGRHTDGRRLKKVSRAERLNALTLVR